MSEEWQKGEGGVEREAGAGMVRWRLREGGRDSRGGEYTTTMTCVLRRQ